MTRRSLSATSRFVLILFLLSPIAGASVLAISASQNTPTQVAATTPYANAASVNAFTSAPPDPSGATIVQQNNGGCATTGCSIPDFVPKFSNGRRCGCSRDRRLFWFSRFRWRHIGINIHAFGRSVW